MGPAEDRSLLKRRGGTNPYEQALKVTYALNQADVDAAERVARTLLDGAHDTDHLLAMLGLNGELDITNRPPLENLP